MLTIYKKNLGCCAQSKDALFWSQEGLTAQPVWGWVLSSPKAQ